MRTPLYLALLAASGLAGFASASWSGRERLPAVTPAPVRPKPLEDAWRAHAAGQAAALAQALALLAADPPEDPGARAEVALLRALAGGDERALVALAEGQGVRRASVVAGAQRELAARARDPQERRRWSERFVREFPASWARDAVARDAAGAAAPR